MRRVGRKTYPVGARGFGLTLTYQPKRGASVAWRLVILLGHTVREFHLYRSY